MLDRIRSYRPSNWARLLLVGDWSMTLNGSRLHEIMVNTMTDKSLQCFEGTSVSATKAIL